MNSILKPIKNILGEKDYCFFKLEELNDTIVESFEYLPYDNYLKTTRKFRKRRYSTGYIIDNIFDWYIIENNQFHQSSTVNTYLGDIKRHYEPLYDITKHFLRTNIISNILIKLPIFNYKVGVHQIRVTADSENMGLPVPEGIHQDGFDYVCTLSVYNQNVTGGNSILLTSKDSQNILFEHILQPKDCLIINDKKLFHYASPIVPKLPGDCHRDVFVITFEKISLIF